MSAAYFPLDPTAPDDLAECDLFAVLHANLPDLPADIHGYLEADAIAKREAERINMPEVMALIARDGSGA